LGCHKVAENFLVGKFSCKKSKHATKQTHIWKQFKSKFKIVSTHNIICRKLGASVRKISTFCPAYFFNPPRCWAENRQKHSRLIIGKRTDIVSVCIAKWWRWWWWYKLKKIDYSVTYWCYVVLSLARW